MSYHNLSRVKFLVYYLIISLFLSIIELTSKLLSRNYLRIRVLKLFSSKSQHLKHHFNFISCKFHISNSHSQRQWNADCQNASIGPNCVLSRNKQIQERDNLTEKSMNCSGFRSTII